MDFYFTYLYQPVFNLLIWIYNLTGENMGLAVILLTVLLRIALLPFTIISERNRVKNEELYIQIKQLQETYKNDAVVRKEEIRKVLKKRRVQPWSRVILLGVQALVLLLLYQVFNGGIAGERLIFTLYESIDVPGTLDSTFLGSDLKKNKNVLWSGIVGLYLAFDIYFAMRKRPGKLDGGDLVYFLLFPAAVFVVLWILPMSKALFTLTSMIFSSIMGLLITPFFRSSKPTKTDA